MPSTSLERNMVSEGVIGRNKTLGKVIRERDAEIARRATTVIESKSD
jgi:hypothetical protein